MFEHSVTVKKTLPVPFSDVLANLQQKLDASLPHVQARYLHDGARRITLKPIQPTPFIRVRPVFWLVIDSDDKQIVLKPRKGDATNCTLQGTVCADDKGLTRVDLTFSLQLEEVPNFAGLARIPADMFVRTWMNGFINRMVRNWRANG